MNHTPILPVTLIAIAAASPAGALDLDTFTNTLNLETVLTTLNLDSLLETLEQTSHGEMSPLGMFMAADWVVKGVMLSLLFASALVWVIFAAKIMILRWERGTLRRAYRALDKAGTLQAAQQRFAKRKGTVGQMVRAAQRERSCSGDSPAMKPGIKERVSSELSRIEAGAARRMSLGAGVLANVGSTAPFVGLFGTVWGIMNSFISISQSNTTNLAIVAPGIAEALLATAIGLVAAIPAVIFYNILARAMGGYKVMLADAGALVERTLSRDLDLAAADHPPEVRGPRLAAVSAPAAE